MLLLEAAAISLDGDSTAILSHDKEVTRRLTNQSSIHSLDRSTRSDMNRMDDRYRRIHNCPDGLGISQRKRIDHPYGTSA
jgi:hypothetical protein